MRKIFRPAIRFPLLVVFLALAVFGNSLKNDFAYDDFREVVDNPLIKSLRLRELSRLYFRGPDSLSAPPARVFPLISYAVNYSLHGLAAPGYHLVNVLLHGLISLLIYGATLRLFPGRSRLAFLTAALFALHPVHADVVNPVAGRAELISSFFFLLILLIYLKNTPAPRSDRRAWFWITLPMFLVGALSKETSWCLPLVMAGCDFYRFRPPPGDSLAKYRPVFLYRLRAFYLPYLLVPALIFGVILAVGYAPGEGEGWANFLRFLAPAPRIAAALGIFARYLVLLVFPVRLSCDYGYAQLSCQPESIRLLWTAGGALAGAAGVLLGLVSLRKRGSCFLAVWLFAAPYLIVSNLLMVINTPMAERLLYLPSWGFCLLAALILRALLRRPGKGKGAAHSLPWLVPASVLVLYGARTLDRNRDWESQAALMESAYRVCPMSGRVNYNLALVYEGQGRNEDALSHYLRAAAILPRHPVMRLNLGNILVKLGRREEAAASYREAIRLDPGDPRSHSNLGRVSGEMNRWADAVAAYRRTAELAPADPVIFNNLGIALYRAGDREESVRAFRKALALDPDFRDPRRNLELLQAYPGGE